MRTLLPRPRSAIAGRGALKLAGGTVALTGDVSRRLRRAVERLPIRGLRLTLSVAGAAADTPALDDDYGYDLVVGESDVRISARTDWGALAGLATLTQLADGTAIARCSVSDAPRFAWRGLMIDVARHFIDVATLRRTLDAMGYFKLNVLHLHLCDDQSFRFPSARYPELVSKEHYTEDELIELVADAADRGIRVVPELDVPGHATSWLLAHPEWGAGDAPSENTHFGVYEAALDPANPDVIEALGHIFEELARIFPDEYVHFGGDEVRDEAWTSNARTRAYMGKYGIKDARGLQAAFNVELVGILGGLGKKAVGWDEALHEDLPTEVLVQCWRGAASREIAVAAGYDCLFSAAYYLDLFFPADVHYRYDPEASPADFERVDAEIREDIRFAHVQDGLGWGQGFGTFPALPERERGKVLGGEGCMFSELVTDDLLDRRVWSRMPALAERFWSAREVVAVDDFYERLRVHLRRLGEIGVMDLAIDPRLSKYEGLEPLLEMLEPVKWYARLLGMDRVRARANGQDESGFERPYTTTTPLDRVVDRIAPESLAARRCARQFAAGHDMSAWVHGWRSQRTALVALVDRFPELAELAEVSAALESLADVVEAGGKPDAGLAGPFGEYVLAVVFGMAR